MYKAFKIEIPSDPNANQKARKNDTEKTLDAAYTILGSR